MDFLSLKYPKNKTNWDYSTSMSEVSSSHFLQLMEIEKHLQKGDSIYSEREVKAHICFQ